MEIGFVTNGIKEGLQHSDLMDSHAYMYVGKLWRIDYSKMIFCVTYLTCMLYKEYCFNVMIIKVHELVCLESCVWMC